MDKKRYDKSYIKKILNLYLYSIITIFTVLTSVIMVLLVGSFSKFEAHLSNLLRKETSQKKENLY
ncbi:MAG: hypothetical protein JEY99_16425 [Spirochaetales bacterium]|nr:hypothetical protein [Spirochaetales bacterium]